MKTPSPAFWSSSAVEFVSVTVDTVMGELARRQVHHYVRTEAEQSPAWRDSILALQAALSDAPGDWWVLLEYSMLRINRRIDAVLLTSQAIIVLEFKREQADANALRQVDDYALDLFYFHEHCRVHPVVPLLVSGGAPQEPASMPLFWDGCIEPVRQARPEHLGRELAAIAASIGHPRQPLLAPLWLAGAYRPVPTIIEAACMLYSRNGVAEIAAARADQRNLNETTHRLREMLDSARERQEHVILFVTGIPGAGKTLCGLNAAFGGSERERGTFLTGNPTLVHVLREALLRDAVDNGADKRSARKHMEGVIQALPHFRTRYLTLVDECPSETILVIDEAQRCWSRDYAVRKTRDKPLQLTDSEPGHLLDIAGRHAGFAGIVCLVGSGQEIHDGEGGLAEWGLALRARPGWRVAAAPDAVGVGDARWLLGAVEGVVSEPALHLDVPVRQIRNTQAASWVDAVLRGEIDTARDIAAGGALPFRVTRDLAALRGGLRALSRGERRAGLLASSGGRRLRAEGLGAELPHMDASAVAHWFLDRFPPDVRASDALEQVATEFSCQGLELDHVGLCWDADLIWDAGARTWVPRNFVGTKWQIMRTGEAVANQINTYRVLLTRARYETLIFVPRGDACDVTRNPALYDAIGDMLMRCGAGLLQEVTVEPAHEEAREAVLF